ncbi:MAG: cyclic nucleotide-binding domain-containing protein, partial [Candidatus Aegiribacteria sp.]|nr:cyclic nucleotide-binding domain-containing protein [Candidatus Aegiribacteria sp.]
MKVGQLFINENILLDSEMIPYYEEVHLNDGQVMIFQGELTTDLFIITSGKLEVVEGSGDTAVRLALLTENDVFGEVAFFDEDERSATV